MDSLDAVLKYLRDQNRPYNANDIATNLHNEFGKTVVQKSLDKLVEVNKIIVKTYGKQKVYAIKQDIGKSSQDFSKELQELDDTESRLSGELINLEKELSDQQKKLRTYLAEPTTEALKTSVSEIDETIEQLNSKLIKINKNPVHITQEEMKVITQQHETVIKLWNKRKRLCMNAVDTILENYPRGKTAFLEEVCIETDEDCGVVSSY